MSFLMSFLGSILDVVFPYIVRYTFIVLVSCVKSLTIYKMFRLFPQWPPHQFVPWKIPKSLNAGPDLINLNAGLVWEE